MFKRILLATDGSAVVERIITYALHLARAEPAEIVVMHAYRPPEQYLQFPGYDELIGHYQAVAQAVVDDVMQALRIDGVQVRGEVRLGEPSEAIIAAASEHEIDLVLMGVRGSGNLAAVLGSVSNQVLHAVSCPVLVVP